ncbi:MAG: biotin carboxylase N-terminal domain-containing protein, partial [Candidatus Sericytochromatia bacterium]
MYKNFHKVLVANRGEIAARILRACRERGLATVAVYSDADRQAKHLNLADEAVHIGPAPSRESYLNIEAILQAAARTGAEAIHPGYGFLAENADFASRCLAAGLVWIGPQPEAIAKMGSKTEARQLAQSLGIPVIPGWQGACDDATLLAQAEGIGFPLLL